VNAIALRIPLLVEGARRHLIRNSLTKSAGKQISCLHKTAHETLTAAP